MKNLLYASVVEGTFNGKHYKSGRLLVADYKENAKYPAFVTLQKCSAELAEKLRPQCPLVGVTFLYDDYRNIVSVDQK